MPANKPGVRGVALIEALVALLVMAFGMVAVAGLMGTMRRGADLAKQRGDALRMAQQQMEQLRDYGVLMLPATPDYTGQRDYATDIPLSPDAPTALPTQMLDHGNTSYTVTQQVTALPDAPARAVNITIQWLDRANESQFVSIDSFISRADPGLSAALSIAPVYTATQRPPNGKTLLPPGARDLSNGTSALKPQIGGTIAWVFNNLSGMITGVCTVPAGTATSALQLSDLSSCTVTSATYLGGYIRFSATVPPVSDTPNSTALPLHMVLATYSGATTSLPTYQCFDDAPAAAVTTQSFVNYSCIVYPSGTATINGVVNTPVWSAQLDIADITLGGNDWKVCRYSADYDGNGTTGNSEHPLNYSNVYTPLLNQNFLVVKAAQTCPAGHSVDVANGIYSNTVTVQHQP
ncbi:hypothetical protein SNE35_15090 [Paucibacter sp. R3-3]|uniref:Uncharacterized protein n=1 Tax=Roseateles agri TaxID=3098619 RepID=A0ABU5DKP6_9BURK|nr:hypothetical protein [Paucibacter sp. R3-3]MDY0745844.1 hypothetical protein [Paucibacter sp. R3-3]